MRFLSRVFCALFMAVLVVFGGFGGAFAADGFCTEKKECAPTLCFDLYDTNNEQIGRTCVTCEDSENADITKKNNADLYDMLFGEKGKYYGQYKGFYDSQGETAFNSEGAYLYSDLSCKDTTVINDGTFDGESINMPLYMTPKSASSGWPTVDMCEEWNKGFEGRFGYFYDYLNGNSEYAYASQYSCEDLISKAVPAGSDIIGDPNNPCLCECADDGEYIDLNAAYSCWFDGDNCDKVCTSEPEPCKPKPMQPYLVGSTWQCCYFYNQNISDDHAKKGCITSVDDWLWFLETIGYNPTTTGGGYVGADGLVYPCPANSTFDTNSGICLCDATNEPVDIDTGTCPAATSLYTITSNYNSGTCSPANPTSYTSTDPTITLCTPTRTGYTFGGWYTTSNFSGSAVTSIPSGSTGNKVFYAKWTANTYTISYELNSGTQASSGVPTSYTYGVGATVNGTPTRTGYTFGGWCTTSALTSCANTQTISTTATGTKTFYAKWTPVVSGAITLDSKKYASSTASSGTTPSTTASPTTLYTKYGVGVYTSQANANSGSGAITALTRVPNGITGYNFDGFYTGKAGTGTNVIYSDGSLAPTAKTAVSTAGATSKWYAHWTPKTSYVAFTANSPTYNGMPCFDIGPVNGQQQAEFGSSNILVYSFIATYGENLIPVPDFHVTKMFNNSTCNKYSFDGFYDATAGGTKYYNVNNTPTQTWDKEDEYVSLYAHWTQNPTYTVTLKGADDSTTFDTIFYNSSAGWTDENGNSITSIGTVPVALSAMGYSRRVNGWYTAQNTGGTQIINQNGVIASNASVSGNTTLYVHGDKYVPVTLDAGNGEFDGVSALPVTVKHLHACITCSSSQWLRDVEETTPVVVSSSLSITPPEGYTYSGFKDTAGTTVMTSTTLPDSRNIQILGNNSWTAQYTPRTYTVTLNWAGNVSSCASAYSGMPSTVTATYNANMPTLTTKPNNSNASCQFLGFYKSTSYVASEQYYNQSGNSTHVWNQATNATIYAKWGFKCNHGYYKNSSNTCVQCPAGSYCPGGVYERSSSDAGIIACPARQSTDFGGDTYAESGTTYVTSDAGASKVTDCYITYLPKDCLETATADMFTHSTFSGIQDIPKDSDYVKVYALSDGTYPDDPDYIVPGRLFSKPGYKVNMDNTYKDSDGTTQTIDISNWPPTSPKSVYGMYGTSCSACAAGTYSRGTGYMVWQSGTSSPYGQCNQDGCPIGTYSLAGSGTCTPCSAGTTTNSTFSTSSSACVACSNAAGVATWETPSWVLYNSAGAAEAQNICTVETCATGYYKSGNACLPYSVKFNPNGGTLSGTSPLYSKYNNANLYTSTALSQTATVPTATKTGHTFAGWYTAASGGSQVYNASRVLQNVSGYTSGGKWQLSGNKILYARFSPASYTVTYDCGTGTGTAPANGSATYGSNFVPAANTCTKSGYAFAGWAVSGTNDIYANKFTWNYTQNKTLTAHWFEDKFQITTTSLAAGDFVDFQLTAQGTFYVDCGHGGTLTGMPNNIIVKNDTNADMYRCTYTTSGVKNIRFGGLATDYKDDGPAISFYEDYSGNTLDSRQMIAAVSGNMSAVFPYISANEPEGNQPRFILTFKGASNLTSVDPHLFDNYTTASTGMFNGTFLDAGLTSVPDGLFENITNVAPYAFGTTFAGASHISGYIPKNTFLGIIDDAPDATHLWANTFDGTHLLNECPVDTRDVDTNYWGTDYIGDAQWGDYAICETANPFTITLNLNTTGATAGSPTTLYMQYYGSRLFAYSDATHTTSINSITIPTKPGYSFEGFKVGNDTVVDSDGNIDTRLMYEEFYTGNKTANAQWDLGEYTITLNNTSATSAGTTKIYTTYNTNVYLDSGHSQVMSTSANGITVPSKTGYTFGGYYSGSGGTGTQYITETGKITQDGINAGKALTANGIWYARWEANRYTVEYALNGGSNGTNHPTSGIYNSEFTVDNPTHAHGTFAGWNVSGMDSTTHYYGASSANTSSTATSWTNSTITSSIKKFKNLRATDGTVTFTAKWTCAAGYTGDDCATVTSYSIAYKDGSTTMTGLTPTSYTVESETITLPTPTKTGYTFGGWYDNSGLTGTAVTTIAQGSTGNKTFYAKWTINSYTITVNAGNGIASVAATGWTNTGSASMSKSYNYGETINLAAASNNVVTPTQKTGYTGAAYTKTSGEGTLSNGVFTVGVGDATITVAATGLNAPQPDIAVNTTSRTYNYATIVLTGSNSTEYDSGVQVTYDFGYASSATGTYGNWVDAPAATPTKLTLAKTAYRGTRYYKVRATATDGVLTSDTVVSSTYKQASFLNRAITFNANGGTLSGTSPIYAQYSSTVFYTTSTGTTQIAKPTASREGYDFAGWYTAESGGSMVYDASGTITSATISGYTGSSTLRPTANRILYAHWTPIDYTISYELNSGTQATSGVPASYTYGVGATVNGTPTRAGGYTFAGWCTDSGLTSCAATQTISTTATGNKTFYAKWTSMNVSASNKTLTYTGSAQSCGNVTVSAPSGATIQYAFAGSNNSCSGVTYGAAPTMTNVSESPKTICYKVSATNYSDKTGTYTCTMNKADCTVNLGETSGSTAFGTNKTTTASTTSNATLSAVSSATGVATANVSNGTLTMTPVAQGTSTITVTSPETANYNECSATYALTVTRTNCSITVTPTSGTITYPTTTGSFDINWGNCNGTKTVTSSDTNKATVAFNSNKTAATVTFVNAGTATITVKSAQSNQYNQATATYTATLADGTIQCTGCGNKSWTYDGNAHSCNISGVTPSGATIEYATKTGDTCGTYSTTAPGNITNVSESKTLCYRISSSHYTTKTGSYTCNITKANSATTVKDGSNTVANSTSTQVVVTYPSTKSLTATCDSGATPTISSATTTVATAAISNGAITLTPVATGTSVITVTCPATSNYNASTSKFTFKVNAGTITCADTAAGCGNKSWTFDTDAHSCAIAASSVTPSGATIKYRTASSGDYTLTTAPSVTNVADSKTVYYQISAANYTTKTGSYTCNITKATMTPTASNNSKNWNGAALTCNGNTWSGVPADSTTYYSTNGGTNYTTTAPTRTNAGTQTINWKVTNPNYNDATGTFTCTVNKVACGVTLGATSGSTAYPTNKTTTVSTASGCTLSASSSATSVATASISGTTLTMTPAGVGDATITVTATPDGNHTQSTATYALTVTKGACTVNLSATSGTITYPTTSTIFTATSTSGGALSVSPTATGSNIHATAAISNGTVTVTPRSTGTQTITVTSDATTNYNACSATYTATVASKTITISSNNGTGTCAGGSITCSYGSSCTAPSWNSSTCAITKGTGSSSMVLTGWNTADNGSGTDVAFGGDASNASTLYAVWVAPECLAGTGVGETSLNSVSNNAPVCNKTSSAGNYCTASTQTGTAGSTSVTTTCSACSSLGYPTGYTSGTFSSAAGSTANTACKFTGPSKSTPENCATITANTMTYSGTAWPTPTYKVTSVAGKYITANNVANPTCAAATNGCYTDGANQTSCKQCSALTGVSPANGTYSSDGSRNAKTTCLYTAPNKTISGCATVTSQAVRYTSNNTWPASTYAVTANEGYIIANNNTNSATCSICTGATFSAGGTATSCSSCPSGYTANTDDGKSENTQCQISVTGGHYIGESGQNSSNWGTCANWTYKAVHTVNYGSTSSCDGTCPNVETNWTKGTGTGWSAVTQCYETRNATDMDSDCSAGVAQKNATNATTWGTATASTPFQAKSGRIVNGLACDVCPNWTYSAGGTAIQCTACIASETGWTKRTGTGWSTYADCKETKTSTAINSLCYGGVLTKTQSSATAWGSSTITTALTAKKGAYVNGQTCSACTGATYQDTDGSTATSCTACSTLSGVNPTGGTYAGSGNRDAKTTCKYTAPNKTINGCATVTSQQVTYSGTAWPASTYAVTANAGYIIANNNTNSATCSICTGATFSAGGAATSCSSCPSGYDADLTNGKTVNTQCKIRVAGGHYIGTAGQNSSNWGTCTAAQYKEPHLVNYNSTSSCSSCPTGYTANTSTGKAAASACTMSCAAGNYMASGTYTRLEYLQSSGAQYINTGIVPNSLGYEVAAKASFSTLSSGPNVMWGFMANGTLPRWLLASHSNGYLLNANTTSVINTNANTQMHTFVAKVYENNGTAYWSSAIDGSTIQNNQALSSLSSWYNNTLSIYLFARNNGGSAGNYVTGKLYEYTIKKDNSTLQHLIPVRRNSDSKLGMLDLISGTFYQNAGSGTFTAGPDVGAISGTCSAVGSGYYAPAATIGYGSVAERSECPIAYHNTAAGAGSQNDCYLTTTATKYVATAGAGETNCLAGDFCAGGTTIYYGGTHSSTHLTYGGNSGCPANSYCAAGASAATTCTSATSSKYTKSAANSTSINDCYLNLTAGYKVATAGAGQTKCTGATFSGSTAAIYYGGNVSGRNTTSSCSNCPSGYTANTDDGKSANTQCQISVTGGHYIGESGQNSSDWETCANWTYKAVHTVNYGSTSSCDGTCPNVETNWTKGTGTGWSAVTQCYETRNATNVSSNCSAGQLKKNATNATTWGGSTISSPLSAKAGSYVSGQTCNQCATGSYTSAAGAQTSCTMCANGTTTNGTGQTSCNATCINNNNYDYAWATPAWNNNNPTNVCTVNSCAKGSYYTSAYDLPSGFTPLTYLASTGTQFINTGFVPSADFKHTLVFEATSSANSSKYICGSGVSEGRSGNVRINGNVIDGIFINKSAALNIISSNITLNGKTTLVLDLHNNAQNIVTVNGGQNISNSNKGTVTSSKQLQLFALSNSYLPTGIRIYSSIIEQNGVIVHHFVPAKRNSDNVLGMYDIKTGTFKTNAGTGTFTAGPVTSYANLCDVCSGATFQPTDGSAATSCSACPSGYTANTTAGKSANTQCQISCAGGSYVATAKQSCVNVGAGYYVPTHLVNYNSVTPTSTRKQCSTGLTTIGYGAGADEAGDCGRKLHVGTNVIYLRSTSKTTPSFRVDSDNDGEPDLFGNMSESSTPINMSNGASDTLKTKYNNKTYYIYDDSAL